MQDIAFKLGYIWPPELSPAFTGKDNFTPPHVHARSPKQKDSNSRATDLRVKPRCLHCRVMSSPCLAELFHLSYSCLISACQGDGMACFEICCSCPLFQVASVVIASGCFFFFFSFFFLEAVMPFSSTPQWFRPHLPRVSSPSSSISHHHAFNLFPALHSASHIITSLTFSLPLIRSAYHTITCLTFSLPFTLHLTSSWV